MNSVFPLPHALLPKGKISIKVVFTVPEPRAPVSAKRKCQRMHMSIIQWLEVKI